MVLPILIKCCQWFAKRWGKLGIVARYDVLVTMNGEEVRDRRKRLGLSLVAASSIKGSASRSIWQLAEAGEEISERSANKISALLDRLEAERVATVVVPIARLEELLTEIRELTRRIEALESQPEGDT